MKPNLSSMAKLPKLLLFQNGKDELYSYLQRFEWFATTNKWKADQWAPALRALLMGTALEVYSRQSDKMANDYAQLKEALMNNTI